MPPPLQQNIRINLADLKFQILKTLGLDRAGRYFNYLNRFLSQKLRKSDFDKLCYITLGRENLHLHNQLIRSVLKNACSGTVPPPLPEEAPISIAKKDNFHCQSGSSPASILSNVDVFSTSVRKVRSGTRDRRCKERPSPLGSNGNTAHQSIAAEGTLGKAILENGEANLCDLDRPIQHYHELAERLDTDSGASCSRPMKRPRLNQSVLYNPMSVHSVMEEEEEITGGANFCRGKSPLRAPLGIPFCSASVGRAHRGLPTMKSSFISSAGSMELPDTKILRKRMEHIAGAEGLEGVSLDCANLLNNGLDVYLKRLIHSCIELVGLRSGREQIKQYINKPHGKVINGVLPAHHVQKQSSGGPVQVIPDSSSNYSVSLLDFKSAMELNAQQLGEDWPLLLEKICISSFKE